MKSVDINSISHEDVNGKRDEVMRYSFVIISKWLSRLILYKSYCIISYPQNCPLLGYHPHYYFKLPPLLSRRPDPMYSEVIIESGLSSGPIGPIKYRPSGPKGSVDVRVPWGPVDCWAPSDPNVYWAPMEPKV